MALHGLKHWYISLFNLFFYMGRILGTLPVDQYEEIKISKRYSFNLVNYILDYRLKTCRRYVQNTIIIFVQVLCACYFTEINEY